MKTYLDVDEILRHSHTYIGKGYYDDSYLDLVSAVPEEAIRSLPPADVVEVQHGKWIQKGRKIYCSKCNRGVYIGTDDEDLMQDEMRLRHFCSACGAKMDGGKDNG